MSAYDKNDPKHPSYAERAFDRYDDFRAERMMVPIPTPPVDKLGESK